MDFETYKKQGIAIIIFIVVFVIVGLVGYTIGLTRIWEVVTNWDYFEEEEIPGQPIPNDAMPDTSQTSTIIQP